MSDSNELLHGVPVTSSGSLETYRRDALERVRTELPLLAARLKSIGVASVAVEYDGCGDSGQIEDVTCRNAQGDPVELTGDAGVIQTELSDLLYDLLEVRHPGWENNDGACGEFEWDLQTDALRHTHRDRFTDYEIMEHEGV
jgi:hypothetical protein